MTAQASDQFEYNSNEFAIAGIKGHALFNPADHNLHPIPSNSACLRGFVCKYFLKDDGLCLKELVINTTERPASIEGCQPLATQGFFDYAYRKMRLPISFTGGLLIGRDFLQDLYVRVGFAPAWKFRDVRELLFKGGKLTSAKNRSLEMRRFREEMSHRDLGPKNPDDRQSVEAWITRAFRLDYRYTTRGRAGEWSDFGLLGIGRGNCLAWNGHQGLGAREMIEAVERDVKAFSEGTVQGDDLTIVVVKRVDARNAHQQ